MPHQSPNTGLDGNYVPPSAYEATEQAKLRAAREDVEIVTGAGISPTRPGRGYGPGSFDRA